MTTFRTALTSAAALVAAFGLLATPATAQRETFSETTSVVLVEVPVTVTVDGEPVRGLTKEDFEIVDGRRKQEIVDFEVIDLGVTSAERRMAAGTTPASSAARRHFLFLFDLTFSQPSSIVKARRAALQLAEEGLHPNDLAAVAVYTLNQGPRILLGFTPDRQQLALAIETLGSPNLVDRVQDPLGLVFADADATGGQEARDTTLGGATDEAVAEYLEDIAGLLDTNNREDMVRRVTAMTRQLADLAKLMDSIDGRKHVVYLSEGFDDQILVGSGGDGPRQGFGATDLSAGATTTSTSDAIASGEVWSASSDVMFGSGKVQNDLMEMLQEFKKADCVIQAVDIGGLRDGGNAAAPGANALSAMASETGGEVFRNYNDLGAAMGEMLERNSVTYVLAFQPKNLDPGDDKFRRLKVRLKDGPRGARLLHRTGYYPPKPFQEQPGIVRQLQAAGQLMGSEGGAFATSVLATPFPAANKPYVPLLVEMGGSGLLAGTTGDVLPLELYAYALDDRGAVHDFFAQTLPIDLSQVRGALEQSGLKYFGHLDLAPGSYDVRVLIRNVQNGRSSLAVFPIEVPDFGASQPVVTQPFFPEELGKWVVVREEADRQRNDVGYPFMMKDQPFIPAARPIVGRKGETEIPLAGFNLGDGKLKVEGRLVAADGSEQKGVAVSLSERIPAGPGQDLLMLRLKHSGLAPGSYTLEVSVVDPASGAETTSATPLVVAKG